MARNSKNWTYVTINGVEFSKRPTKLGKGTNGILAGYAQVPSIPDNLPEEDAKQLLSEWLEDGVLGYRQTLVATINALAVQTQAAVRRKYESAKNGKHSPDALYNIGFNHLWATNKQRAMDLMSQPIGERTTAFVAAAQDKLKLGIDFSPETNIVTSDNTMSTDSDLVQDQ